MIQAYRIITEVEQILKCPIDQYYIECSRTNQARKVATNSRYFRLKELYKNCKSLCMQMGIDYAEINKKLDENKDKLRSDMLYLYFTQLGKCMYSLDNIDLDDLLSNYKYDIDHIYPQSIIKDDSLSNRVLTRKDYNNRKSDNFIFEIQGFLNPKAYQFYNLLREKELITKEKYERLTKKELNPAELDGFVNRQIVATNQAVKGLIDVLKIYKNIDQKNIIYSKAENISMVRQQLDIVKSRTANNYHHAHDAYLNVVVGRALNKYYSMYAFNGFKDYARLKAEGITVNPEKILKYDRKFKDNIIWNKDKTIALLKKNIYNRFDIIETQRSYNSNTMFNKTTILPASEGSLVPVKATGKASDTKKYGGITSNSYSKYVILMTKNKKGIDEYYLEPIPRMYIYRIEEYLKTRGYSEYKICHENIKSNVLVEQGKLRYYITGISNSSFYIKNANDRYFKEEFIKTIKKLEKYSKNKTLKQEMEVTPQSVIVSPKGEKGNAIEISKDELKKLIEEIKHKFSIEKYGYSIIIAIRDIISSFDFENCGIEELITICIQLLLLLKTNERKSADLRLIGMSANSGILAISKKLQPGMKFISESVTGYYDKVLFEVPGNGI